MGASMGIGAQPESARQAHRNLARCLRLRQRPAQIEAGRESALNVGVAQVWRSDGRRSASRSGTSFKVARPCSDHALFQLISLAILGSWTRVTAPLKAARAPPDHSVASLICKSPMPRQVLASLGSSLAHSMRPGVDWQRGIHARQVDGPVAGARRAHTGHPDNGPARAP